MANPGVVTPVIDLTVTLPTKRKDDSAMGVSDIASVTILRNSVEWQTLSGPFSSPVRVSDTSPVTTEDTYSFYVTDTQGVRSDVSSAVTVSTATEPPKAPPAVGILSAVAQGKKPSPPPAPAPPTPPAAAK